MVTLGLETDFPEDERNTDPGAANVADSVTYMIANVSKVGTANIGPPDYSESPMVWETHVKGEPKYGAR